MLQWTDISVGILLKITNFPFFNINATSRTLSAIYYTSYQSVNLSTKYANKTGNSSNTNECPISLIYDQMLCCSMKQNLFIFYYNKTSWY